ncbi:MAG: pimeloyl-CoA dehydrogenase small subunit [Proteobacteria bacterium SG_bin9]|nr:MAG: pimeloyl-CoA dehydrogenase small subunit [Proteobacteria bacterium SG_bin9]
MDIELNEEQRLLKDSVQKMLADQYGFDQRRRIVASEEGWSRSHWRAFADLGLQGVPIPPEMGGLGGGPVETMIVMEEFGRHLVVEPFLETVIVCATLLRRAGNAAQQQKWLPAIASGEAVWALAWMEPASRYALGDCSTTIRREGDTYELRGTKSAVTAAPWADYFIVSARNPDDNQIELFVVARDAPGVTFKSYSTVDGRRAADVQFDRTPLTNDDRLGQEDAVAALQACRDTAVGALCAESLGLMSELNNATLSYAKSRKQFGVPLGSFQALQHRMVDMFVALEESRSLTQYLHTLLVDDDAIASKIASAAKSKVGEMAKFVGEQSIQLHGGMGMSDELDVGHYFKRIMAINIQFGDPTFHLLRFAGHS